MRHRRFWACFTLVLFLTGLAASAYGLYTHNTAITRSSLLFILLGAAATFLLKRDFQRELDEIDAQKQDPPPDPATEDQAPSETGDRD